LLQRLHAARKQHRALAGSHLRRNDFDARRGLLRPRRRLQQRGSRFAARQITDQEGGAEQQHTDDRDDDQSPPGNRRRRRQREAEMLAALGRDRFRLLVVRDHASSSTRRSVDAGGLRRRMLYITGTKNSVVTVARKSPPTTARPSGAFCSPPSPRPSDIGSMPSIIASAVMITGRMRVIPAACAARVAAKPIFL